MQKKRAFTLVEIMIVVLIIGILIAIAVPNWIKARQDSQRATCIENLKKMSAAKEMWAMENRKSNGDPVQMSDLNPTYLKGNPPTCASGGVYTVMPVGTEPVCSLFMAPNLHYLP